MLLLTLVDVKDNIKTVTMKKWRKSKNVSFIVVEVICTVKEQPMQIVISQENLASLNFVRKATNMGHQYFIQLICLPKF